MFDIIISSGNIRALISMVILFFVSKTMYSEHEKCKWHKGTKGQNIWGQDCPSKIWVLEEHVCCVPYLFGKVLLKVRELG